MENQDKLSHDERLRLECLAQAVAFSRINNNKLSAEGIIREAEQFERYLKGPDAS